MTSDETPEKQKRPGSLPAFCILYVALKNQMAAVTMNSTL